MTPTNSEPVPRDETPGDRLRLQGQEDGKFPGELTPFEGEHVMLINDMLREEVDEDSGETTYHNDCFRIVSDELGEAALVSAPIEMVDHYGIRAGSDIDPHHGFFVITKRGFFIVAQCNFEPQQTSHWKSLWKVDPRELVVQLHESAVPNGEIAEKNTLLRYPSDLRYYLNDITLEFYVIPLNLTHKLDLQTYIEASLASEFQLTGRSGRFYPPSVRRAIIEAAS